MRICLVISSLWGGGAERVLSILASGWAEHGHQIRILTFEHREDRAYILHPSVRVQRLGLARQSNGLLDGLRQNLRRLRTLRRAIRESEPDIVVSFMDRTNVLVLLATRGFGTPVVVSERTDPLHYKIGPLWSGLRRLCYPLADMLVCPTVGTLARFRAMVRVRGMRIPNPVVVSPKDSSHQPASNRGSRVLVAMGRLERQKGFDLLLQAFARVADQHTDWSLTIIGKGRLDGELQEQSRALALSERVRFAGEIIDPFALLRASDLFVFSSRSEGFGMALAEAMACGLPVVSFDCPEGPGTIIRDGVDGVLVPPEDVSSLASALDRLMSDAQERARLSARAPEVTERFSRDRVLSQWEELFTRLIAERDSRRR